MVFSCHRQALTTSVAPPDRIWITPQHQLVHFGADAAVNVSKTATGRLAPTLLVNGLKEELMGSRNRTSRRLHAKPELTQGSYQPVGIAMLFQRRQHQLLKLVPQICRGACRVDEAGHGRRHVKFGRRGLAQLRE